MGHGAGGSWSVSSTSATFASRHLTPHGRRRPCGGAYGKVQAARQDARRVDTDAAGVRIDGSGWTMIVLRRGLVAAGGNSSNRETNGTRN